MLPPSRDRQALPRRLCGARRRFENANRESPARGDDEVDRRRRREGMKWVCTGPINYDTTRLERDIANLKAALEGQDVTDAFLPVVAPASAYWLENEHYASEEEFVFALADALHEEYKAIVDAGLLVQVDDAVLMHEADSIMSLGGHGRTTAGGPSCASTRSTTRCAGLPEDRVRYHVCWGSWHGPHVYDPPLKDIVDLVLRVNAGTYAMEQANARHEHEWRVWEDVKLPEGKKLIPGVVTHHTNVVEHPELVAEAARRGWRRSWGGRTCSAAPTAASPRARSSSGCTPRSSGPSSPRSRRAPGSPPGSSGERPSAHRSCRARTSRRRRTRRARASARTTLRSTRAEPPAGIKGGRRERRRRDPPTAIVLRPITGWSGHRGGGEARAQQRLPAQRTRHQSQPVHPCRRHRRRPSAL